VAQVKTTGGRDGFRTYLDEAEVDHQERLRGRQRRLAAKTLTAADDLIIVNLGVEKVIRLTTQGFMPNPEDDEGDALPVGPSRVPRALPAASVTDEMARLRGGASRPGITLWLWPCDASCRTPPARERRDVHRHARVGAHRGRPPGAAGRGIGGRRAWQQCGGGALSCPSRRA
jgi:hypothetical protein